MTSQELAKYLKKSGMSRLEMADRLRVTQAAVGIWIRQGWIAYDRQCHIELEFPGSGLRASWNDIPMRKRRAERPLRLNGREQQIGQR